ncbi:MAG: hypothetical protein ABIO35_08395 [Nitrobacter sp.]
MSETTQTATSLIDLLYDYSDGVLECERATGPFYRRAQADRDDARGAIIAHVRRLNETIDELVKRSDKAALLLAAASKHIDTVEQFRLADEIGTFVGLYGRK